MPAPTVLVTFTDADGDEFPYRVSAFVGRHRQHVIQEGRDLANADIAAGNIAPTLPLRFESVSGCWDYLTNLLVSHVA